VTRRLYYALTGVLNDIGYAARLVRFHAWRGVYHVTRRLAVSAHMHADALDRRAKDQWDGR
jgi:hypothetical protein